MSSSSPYCHHLHFHHVIIMIAIVLLGVVRTPRRIGGHPPGAELPPQSSPGFVFLHLCHIVLDCVTMCLHFFCTMFCTKFLHFLIWILELIEKLTGAVTHLSHNVLPCRSSLGILRVKMLKLVNLKEAQIQLQIQIEIQTQTCTFAISTVCDCSWGSSGILSTSTRPPSCCSSTSASSP